MFHYVIARSVSRSVAISMTYIRGRERSRPFPTEIATLPPFRHSLEIQLALVSSRVPFRVSAVSYTHLTLPTIYSV